MRLSWNLGRVAGIDLYLHPTFFLVLAYPDVIAGGLPAVLLVLSVFGCVLLHEFGHALMARRFGIETEDITLYPIGGVARLRRLPRSPGAELLIALAGPAVNVAIVAGLASFFGLASLAALPLPGAVVDYLSALLLINGLLALFNLVPAFPMDGGRVFRALLSGWLGRVRATRIAAGLGRGLALLYAFYNLTLLLQGSAVHAIQLVLAAFIYFAAGAELARVLTEERQRRGDRHDHPGDGDSDAPPGFRWVARGRGIWQLAPIRVHDDYRTARSWR